MNTATIRKQTSNILPQLFGATTVFSWRRGQTAAQSINFFPHFH